MKVFWLTILFLLCPATVAVAQSSSVKENKIYVIGKVVRPAEVDLESGMTLTRAIAAVGGTLPKAATISVYRRIPGTARLDVFRIKLSDLKKGKIEDRLLQPLDIIEVLPRKRNKNAGCVFSDWRIPAADFRK
ncbi:MAG: SLBB domain-containing protein [Acidobacteria bacterium]|nr:SLBB domain-containing protein [Acidobacteriota bacterium]